MQLRRRPQEGDPDAPAAGRRVVQLLDPVKGGRHGTVKTSLVIGVGASAVIALGWLGDQGAVSLVSNQIVPFLNDNATVVAASLPPAIGAVSAGTLVAGTVGCVRLLPDGLYDGVLSKDNDRAATRTASFLHRYGVRFRAWGAGLALPAAALFAMSPGHGAGYVAAEAAGTASVTMLGAGLSSGGFKRLLEHRHQPRSALSE